MALIPAADIERLKNEVSVERLIESAGIQLTKSGKDKIGQCPFHEDDKPSLVVTPAKNLWHCFGCQTGGGPVDWVMKKNGVSFRHAVELLRESDSSLAAGVGADKSSTVKRATVRALPAPVSIDADDTALLNQVVSYYHDTLKQSPDALAYLKARGLDHPELIDTFKLGYANRTLGLRLPNKQRKDGADIRARLERIGVYRESGHEHFNGSLIVPVLDGGGNATEIYGRKIRDDLRAGTPAHLYLPGPHVGVWNAAALQASQANKEIILCEALVDAMTFWCAGYRNVTAAYGIEGFTDELLAAFKQHQTERVLIAYDRDEAGERAAQKLADKLMVEGIECWRIQLPKGMDVNEYAMKVTPANKSLGVVIRKAVWLGKGVAPQREMSHAAIEMSIAPKPATAVPFAGNAFEKHVDIGVSGNALLKNSPPPVPSLVAALSASPLPPAPASTGHDWPTTVSDNEVILRFAERRYRVRGLAKNLGYEVMKVNVMVSAADRFHVDTFDLLSAKQRVSFLTQASLELQVREDIIKADLGRMLLTLEQLQDEAIRKALTPKTAAAVEISESDERAALALPRSPDLLNRIVSDFDACGIVGEATNKLVGYLAAVSRKLDRPLAIVIQSSSAAGKSSLMDAVLAFMPEEERIKYSAMTGQSLFYMGETNLKHKILAIVEEEGASKASYALKLLQSEGELTIASTGKDPATGNLITQQYRVEGPVMIFLTTTAIEIDEELMNRCLVLSVDEGREQTEAIHKLQRAKRTLQGLIAQQEKQRLINLHCNAQRLLKPLHVVNPYADQLTFLSDKTRTRRDHEKYLTLIDTVALLHQHQRPVKTTTHQGQPLEYIEVTVNDIARANALAHDVLGRSLDELPPQTRRLLGEVVGLVRARVSAQRVRTGEVRFTRKDVRAHVGWSDTQLRVHLERLVDMEYLLAHRDGAGGKFVYELVYDGEGTMTPHLSGLIDIKNMTAAMATTTKMRGADNEVAPRSRGECGVVAGAFRDDKQTETQALVRRLSTSPSTSDKPHISTGNGKTSSYPLAAAAE